MPLALAALRFGWGIVGVWCALLALMGVRLATLAVRFAGPPLGARRRGDVGDGVRRLRYGATASFSRRSMSSSRSKSASSAWR